ncbi:MAG: DNA mismatch repair protein MutS [Sphingomonadales bacterium]
MAKSNSADTPLMQQHRAIKQKYPDAILLFRVGDFYETFGQDAVIAAAVLGITLTKRNNGAAASAELAGFPHHSLDSYLHKLVKAGHRVAVCDQLEDPKQAKGIVKRGVTEMVTPGTATGDKLLEQRSNNFLASVTPPTDDVYGLALLDLSTGEMLLAEGGTDTIDKLLQSFQTAEIVCSKKQVSSLKELFSIRVYTYTLDEWIFDVTYATETLLKHFETHSLKGFGVANMTRGLTAAGALFHYLRETEHPHLEHITRLQRIDHHQFLWMDRFTIRNLELISGTQPESPTLLSVLDNTVTPMGARLLKRWLLFPLIDLRQIEERKGWVLSLMNDRSVREQLIATCSECGDLERLAARIALRRVSPRELRQLASGLEAAQRMREVSTTATAGHWQQLLDTIDPCLGVRERIEKTLVQQPSVQVQKGGSIAPGVDLELDELRALALHGKEYLQSLLQKEIERTGISSLKIGFTNVFGYYLEVTHAHKEKVPADWIRKQTLTQAERYITPELKEYEEKILGAEEKILQLEVKLYEALVEALLPNVPSLQQTAAQIARLDCICCFAENSVRHHYHPASVTNGTSYLVTDGRHPVIERSLSPGQGYIANDLVLDKEQQQVIILTGPNMSGKSALLRQTALITIMAHMGHPVPAGQAQIPLTDRIFTRVGASDNLSAGESTFMVEMNETASIINSLSDKSLVLLDEIGRGTSTYDGISIAWSIAEFLHESPLRPLTVFATHYHELNELESRWPRVKNFHITHRETGNKIIFLRKLEKGGTTHSFGIHVAKMAGMPPTLIKRAEALLRQLEKGREAQTIADQQALTQALPSAELQLSIFDAHTETFKSLRALLEETDLDRLTPLQALVKLQEIKDKLK